MDPLADHNNIGRSVNYSNALRIQAAFRKGADVLDALVHTARVLEVHARAALGPSALMTDAGGQSVRICPLSSACHRCDADGEPHGEVRQPELVSLANLGTT